ncbi:hypothetical protein [Endozoicomonas sp.]|uniref:hypothetical protein n=1 Tax=Endozoicomonas sp. TaxID=1892382 RepID=UPI003AF6793E
MINLKQRINFNRMKICIMAVLSSVAEGKDAIEQVISFIERSEGKRIGRGKAREVRARAFELWRLRKPTMIQELRLTPDRVKLVDNMYKRWFSKSLKAQRMNNNALSIRQQIVLKAVFSASKDGVNSLDVIRRKVYDKQYIALDRHAANDSLNSLLARWKANRQRVVRENEITPPQEKILDELVQSKMKNVPRFYTVGRIMELFDHVEEKLKSRGFSVKLFLKDRLSVIFPDINENLFNEFARNLERVDKSNVFGRNNARIKALIREMNNKKLQLSRSWNRITKLDEKIQSTDLVQVDRIEELTKRKHQMLAGTYQQNLIKLVTIQHPAKAYCCNFEPL